jgi:hypothetical protein
MNPLMNPQMGAGAREMPKPVGMPMAPKAPADPMMGGMKVARFHKGGKIKKDGVQAIDAKAGETILPTTDKQRVMELAMKHLDGMKDGMEAGKKKSAKKESKSEKKEGSKKKKVHPFRHAHIEMHDDGSHTLEMQHESDPTLNLKSAHPDNASMMSQLESNMGPQTLTGASGSPAPDAPAAPGAPA